MVRAQEKRKVVIVDDETGLLQLFQDILGDRYHVIPFSSPDQFLKFLEKHTKAPFEVLITDLKMPGLTGTEMIKSAQSKGFFFPSILLSGHLDKKSIFEAVDLGVYRLLEKPTSPEIVIQAIEELIVEYDIRDVRSDIRNITVQLREYYSYLNLLVSTRIPEAHGKEFSLQTNSKGQVVSQESFEQLLNRLESRLDRLLRSENLLEEIRSKRYKKVS